MERSSEMSDVEVDRISVLDSVSAPNLTLNAVSVLFRLRWDSVMHCNEFRFRPKL